MIAYIPYRSVDKSKYDGCLRQSAGFRVYAQSWFLDAVCEKWDLVVYKDYEAVMPLPKRRKWGLSYVFTPAWVQQLGIFSSGQLDEEVGEAMLRRIPGKFFLVDYCCNFQSRIARENFEIRKNYVLPLEGGMKSILSKLKKNRREAFKKDFSAFRLETHGSLDDLMFLYDKVQAVHQGHKDAREKLIKLIQADPSQMRVWLVYKGEAPVAGMIWLKDHKRLTYLFSSVLPEYRKHELTTFMLKNLMEAHEDSGLLLDFEGSMQPGIAFFFRSFGAQEESYYHYKRKFYGFLG